MLHDSPDTNRLKEYSPGLNTLSDQIKNAGAGNNSVLLSSHMDWQFWCGNRTISYCEFHQETVMSKQEQIAAIRAEIKTRERQLYRANKQTNAWNKGGVKSHFNANVSNLFVESERKEISELRAQLLKLKKEE